MASTAVALQDLPATDAKLVRYLLLPVALHSRQNLQLAMYPFKHLKKSVGRSWMLMADKYGSILNPYYIIYIYIYIIYMGPTSSNNWNNVNDVILTYVSVTFNKSQICKQIIRKMSFFTRSMRIPKTKSLANILAEQVWSLTHTYLFVIHFLLYFTPSDRNECENILCLNALIEATDSIAVVHQDLGQSMWN